MSIFDFLFGTKGKEMSAITKGQKSFLDQLYKGPGVESSPLYQQGSDFLSALLSGEPNSFSQFESPLMANFYQSIVPNLANQFAGMGTGGALSSSGFNQALAQAGSGLQRDIGALRGGLQMQGLGQALNYAQQPFANKLAGLGVSSKAYRPGQQGWIGQFLAALANNISSQ